ncbi:MAG: DUF5606 domain-containing protein [Bacteroidia bacterium]|nr:DUF5606 domain-containing protein [Bacteroidia bacterium]
MQLTGIISVAGQSGLHKVIARSKAGLIVENISDKKRTAIQASEKVSTLEDIGIFTSEDDERIANIFDSIFAIEKGGATSVDHKSDGATLATYFKKVLPNYDTERVYASNIKKVIEWYNLLHAASLLIPSEEKIVDLEVSEVEETTKTKKAKADGTTKTPKATVTKTATPRVNSKGSGGAKGTTRKSGVA